MSVIIIEETYQQGRVAYDESGGNQRCQKNNGDRRI